MADVLRVRPPSPPKGIDSKAEKKFEEIKGKLLRMAKAREEREGKAK